MSTRSQIQFKDKWGTVQIYRHSDGYPDGPSGVIADLKTLKDWVDKTQTFRGAGYLAAQFIFYAKLQALRCYATMKGRKSIDETINAEDDQPYYLLGHGVEDPRKGIHGDEEYLYVVEVGTGAFGEKEKKWLVKVSGHGSFPTWDNKNTGKAFELAKWDFEGTLKQAYKKYVGAPKK